MSARKLVDAVLQRLLGRTRLPLDGADGSSSGEDRGLTRRHFVQLAAGLPLATAGAGVLKDPVRMRLEPIGFALEPISALTVGEVMIVVPGNLAEDFASEGYVSRLGMPSFDLAQGQTFRVGEVHLL